MRMTYPASSLGVGGRSAFRESQLTIDPLMPTGDPLKWGVVSTGNIARTVTKELAMLPDAELHAVSSRSAESARAFAAEFGFTRSYAGHRQLLEDDDVDIVYVAAPHGQHYSIVRDALTAGKHVLCEKAFTIDTLEADDLVRLAGMNRVFLMEALWTRFLPSFQRALQIVHSGDLGTPHWARADLGFPAPRTTPLKRIWDPRAGGGALLDLGVYTLTWPISVFGLPETVTAVGQLSAEGVDQQCDLQLSYKDAFAHSTCSLIARCGATATIAADEGRLDVFEGGNHPQTLVITDSSGEVRAERFQPAGRGYTYELREVMECVRAGKLESDLMPLAETQAVMTLFDEVRRQLGVHYPTTAERAV